ncbi:hypothetical protein DPEC_G00103200 [Dallia pectoralis]|uniref:Uncharacterized protein n=1 Tax=Dallia pectoralis TaxID=75939 RepID=A0ACC2GX93_DALPE|nr:hypothetical protein DPEC_G00103200 [Dallia pectoralis]
MSEITLLSIAARLKTNQLRLFTDRGSVRRDRGRFEDREEETENITGNSEEFLIFSFFWSEAALAIKRSKQVLVLGALVRLVLLARSELGHQAACWHLYEWNRRASVLVLFPETTTTG